MPQTFGKNLHPMDPAKWDTRHLLTYCLLHGLLGEDTTGKLSKEQREKLETLVTTDLCSYYTKSDILTNPVADCDVLNTEPEELFKRRTHVNSAILFRHHPDKLQSILNIGLSMLDEKTLYKYQLLNQIPPLEWWLIFTLDNITCKELIFQESSRVCGRTLSKHEAIAYCLECAFDESCVLCAECFQNSPCKNHKHYVRYGGGDGICDCGDPTAWNPNSFCLKHKGFQKNEDPTKIINSIQKKWLQIILRGLILYQIRILQIFSLNLKKFNIMEKKQRFNLASWFDRALRRTTAMILKLADIGDCTRRLLNIALMEKSLWPHFIHISTTTSTIDTIDTIDTEEEEEEKTTLQTVYFSCLEEIFFANIKLINQKDFIIWDKSFLYLLDTCLCDPLLRVPIAELLLKYGERLSLKRDYHVSTLSIQVFTVKEVVDDLLQKTPHPYWESILESETILHRILSILLHMCSHIQEKSKYILVSNTVVFNCCHWFEEIISASENCKMIVTSRFLFRIWYKILCLIGSNSKIQREVIGIPGFERIHVNKDCAMAMESSLQSVFYIIGNMIYNIGKSLLYYNDNNNNNNKYIPSWMIQIIQSFKSSWKTLPDISLHYSPHYQLLNNLSLLSNESKFLCEIENKNFIQNRLHCAYMRELFMESIKFINRTLEEIRSTFKPQIIVLPNTTTGGLPRYDLLDKQNPNPMSFVKPHMRFFVVLVEIWAKLLYQQKQKKRDVRPEDDDDEEEEEEEEKENEEYFYSLILEVFQITQSRGDYWLDECLMPIVLLGIVEGGLWKPHNDDIDMRYRIYLSSFTSELETDIYLLQLLMLFIPIENYSIQILQRHLYKIENEYISLLRSNFLRLILTLCITEWNIMFYTISDIKRVLQQKIIHGILTSHEYVYNLMEATADGFKHIIPDVNPKNLLPSIVEENTVSHLRKRGQVFYIKDTTTWKANVNIYNPHIRDYHVLDMYEKYEQLTRREGITRKSNETKTSSSSLSMESKVTLPLPNFPWMKSNEHIDTEKIKTYGTLFQQKVYLLLQTPAVLSVAINVIHLYLSHVKEKSKKRTTEDIGDLTLLHAISILYLSIKACYSISSSMNIINNTNEINWNNIKLFQEKFMPPSDYSLKQLKELFPVKGIIDAITLKEKLEMEFNLNNLFNSTLYSSQKHITTITALLQLYEYFKGGGGKDIFGITEMVQYILRGLGALPPVLSTCTEEDKVHDQLRCDEEDERRRRLKEKQLALLRRVKVNDNKMLSKLVKSEDIKPSTTTTTNNDNDGGGDGDGDILHETKGVIDPSSSSSSVVSTLLLRLKDAVCCMCRDQSNEPLMLLANTSTSNVLYRLQFNTTEISTEEKEAGYDLNAHIYICGHVAHEKCVSKSFGRIAKIMTEENSIYNSTTSSTYALNCPVCVMVCTILCPYPILTTTITREEEEGGSFLLFENIRKDTLKKNHSFDKLHQTIAHATIGISSSQSTHHLSVINQMKKDMLIKPNILQINYPHIWGLIETIRTIRNHMYIILEWVKIGEIIRYNEILTLFSLIISINSEFLFLHSSYFKNEFHRTNDGLCLLILSLLKEPKKTLLLLKSYIKLLFLSSEYLIFLTPLTKENEENYNKILISIWRELGCLTLLKAIILNISPIEVIRCNDGNVYILPLDPEGLVTLKGRQCAVITMLCYLLEIPFDNCQTNEPWTVLASLVHMLINNDNNDNNNNNTEDEMLWSDGIPSMEIVRCKPLSVCYDNPSLWRRYIIRHIFHLSDTIGEVLFNVSSHERCSVCGDAEAQRVQCCFCGRPLCARPLLSPPELYNHARTCGRGLGIYIYPSEYTLIILLTVQSCHLHYVGLYTDEYGQSRKHELYGRNATLNDESVKSLLSLWLRSRWEVESSIVTRLVRDNLRRI